MAMSGEQRSDVLAWQNQMYANGWTILPRTGNFDQTTANVAGFLGELVGVNDGTLGVVGPNLWALAFSTWHA
jgi:hypothetical protein